MHCTFFFIPVLHYGCTALFAAIAQCWSAREPGDLDLTSSMLDCRMITPGQVCSSGYLPASMRLTVLRVVFAELACQNPH